MGNSGQQGALASINPVALAANAVAFGAQVYQGVQANQEKQHAIGAAEAEQTAIQGQIAAADKAKADSDAASAATAAAQVGANREQSAAIVKAKAKASGTASSQGSILTSPLGATSAPIVIKSLLGA